MFNATGEGKYPDFFIVGAPKTGSSSVYGYLSEHPQVFMSDPKEPNYFCSDFPNIAQASTDAEYKKLFSDASDSMLTGESSVWYLYSDVAVSNVLKANPVARIIIMLRNHIDMAVSLHGQFVAMLQEDRDDLKEAWALQAERSKGNCLPNYCPEPKLLQYQQACSIGEQVDRVLTAVPRNQVKIILFDDLTQDTKRVYEDIIDFLGVQQDGRSEFPIINKSRAHRFPFLIQFLRNPPKSVNRIMFTAKNALNKMGIHPSEFLRGPLSKTAQRPALDPTFRSELYQIFASDRELLEGILGRDLAHWR